ncbi:uncharacterized protein B0I36DRAFT_43685 [Microdochium trichocladiopsis]|uniref:Uncharacterized protein n=1 Tax=Microdochium trichocladiopsis TaxID=1682393 RepID=A0A9P8XUK0_9PEZI|nr:uncharacterized protein B0I36DRAFT_43685 [Microdochium trichocladiopsis]KAH7016199.1 hypothetical protein B0I36DRAFT_43685 [Microdochium trichocladiopsis]
MPPNTPTSCPRHCNVARRAETKGGDSSEQEGTWSRQHVEHCGRTHDNGTFTGLLIKLAHTGELIASLAMRRCSRTSTATISIRPGTLMARVDSPSHDTLVPENRDRTLHGERTTDPGIASVGVDEKHHSAGALYIKRAPDIKYEHYQAWLL